MDRNSTLLIVHGMGDAEKGATLRGAVTKLVDAMKIRKRDEFDVVTGDYSEGAGPPTVDIHYVSGSGSDSEARDVVVHVAEYWWTESFKPAKPGVVGFWVATRVSRHLPSLAWRHGRLFAIWIGRQLAKLAFWRKGNATGTPGDSFWQTSRLRVLTALAVLVQTVVILGIALPLVVIGPLIFRLLRYATRIPGVPSWVGKGKDLLRNFIVGSMGDIYIVMRDHEQSTKLRDELIAQIEDILDQRPVGPLVLLAHSTGNLIVYEALAHLQSRLAQGEQKAQETIDGIKSWVSIGSILTMAWGTGVIRATNDKFEQPIPSSINWFNLWTRYDYATGAEMKAPETGSVVLRSPVNHRVTNFGSIALDHTAYWDNYEELYYLLLEELGGRTTGNDFWRGTASPLAEVSRHEKSDSEMRRQGVGVLMTTNAIAWISLPVSFALFWIFSGMISAVLRYSGISFVADQLNFSWIAHMISAGASFEPWELPVLALPLAFVVFGILWLVWLKIFKQRRWDSSVGRRRKELAESFKADRAAGNIGQPV